MKSVKYIICKTTYNTYIRQYIRQYVHCTYSVAKVDYRGAATPKKDPFNILYLRE